MSGKKHRGGGSDNLRPWLTPKPDGKREPFIMVANSLMASPVFASLPLSAQRTYMCMAAHASGKIEFVFPQSLASKTYYIPRNSLRAAVDRLVESGFIERVEDGSYSQYAPARYRFAFGWKQSPQP